MIKIHISFWVAAAIFWAIGWGFDFLMLAIAVTSHELSHMICAKAFGCQIRKMHVSALGEMSVLGDMERLAPAKRVAIITAGPSCNLIMAVIALHFGFELFAFYNFILCGFNLLPIFPLDGAKLVQLFLGNRVGVLLANRFTLRAGFICCMILIGLGVIQAILYAPNITMLCMGIVLWYRNRSLQIELTGEFYIAMLNKKPILPVKFIFSQIKQPIADIVNAMGWDYFLIVVCPDNSLINENQVMNHILQHGLTGTLEDALKKM